MTALFKQPLFIKIKRTCASFIRWQPLTVRGAVALAAGITTVRTIALPESDLVAYVIGGSLIGLSVLLIAAVLWARLRLARRMSAAAYFDTKPILSRTPSPAGMVLEHSSLPVFFHLSAVRRFEHRGVISPRHLVKGRESEARRRHLIDSLEFPHRGLWALRAIDFSIGDSFGFTSLSWSVPQSIAVEVSAPTIPIEPLPVLAASARIGDQLSHSQERSGDPFDLKSYDPSDGVKRILWKTFAKSGELMVRRPEPAVIPEGEVAVYLVAAKEDDHVAGALQSYLSQLFRQDMVVLFGTDGSDEARGSLDSSGPVKRTPEEIQKLINCAVWSAKSGTGEGFSSFLTALSETNRPVYHVIVFGAASGSTDWVRKIGSTAHAFNTKLTAALVEDKLAAAFVEREPRRTITDTGGRFYSTLRRKSVDRGDVPAVLTQAGADVVFCQRSHLLG